jgi:hypothetical protein
MDKMSDVKSAMEVIQDKIAAKGWSATILLI